MNDEMRKNTALRLIFSPVLAVLLSGCAATSIFNSYTSEAAKYKNALSTDNLEPALIRLEGKTDGADGLLYLSERGRLYQVDSQFDASKADFEMAIQMYVGREDKARINASAIAASSASLMTNDNAVPYQGQGYERIFLHQFQAFNYLANSNASGAGVELRRAALEQRNLAIKNEKAIAKAEREASENDVELPDIESMPQFQGMNQLVGEVKSGFQNAYTFYTSAVIWEALGEHNAALVDYKKALEINPESTMLQHDVQRLDQGFGDSTQATLIVLFEDGFIPERQSFSFTFPDIYNNKTYSVAFPYYSPNHWYRPVPLMVSIGDNQRESTEVIANFGAMAVKSLKDDIPKMLLRHILRARVKYEMQAQAQKTDPLVGLVATLYNIVSEKADLRSWLTLPNNAQATRLQVSGGEYNVKISTAAVSQQVPVTLDSGRTTILRVFNFNNQLKSQIFQL